VPPIIVAFFILIGAMTGPPVVKGIITPKDASSRSKLGKPAPQEYRTWTSRPWLATSDERTRTCSVTYFALATRERIVRLRAGGQEQSLDSSWSFPRELKEGERRTVALEFRDPVGGQVLSCQEQSVVCYNARTFTTDTTEVREGRCRPDAAAPRKDEGKVRLEGTAPPFRMYDPGIGGAYVDVSFELKGRVTEAWYCPAIEVTWPDGTRTRRESDCPPFDPSENEPMQRRWTFTRGFPGGEWTVRACIEKSGRQLACEVVKVRVLGDSTGGFMGDGR
jgi:hypothetical protein